MDQDFEVLTLNDLKNNSILEQSYQNFQIKEVVSKGLDCTIEQILTAYKDSIQLPSTFKFLLSLLILKITKSAPLPNDQGLNYFVFVEYFCEHFKNESSSMLDLYSTGIILEISQCKCEELLMWAKALSSHSARIELESCIKWLKCNLIRELYSEMRMLGQNLEINRVKRIMLIMDYSTTFGGSIPELIKMFAQNILTQIYESFDISSIKTLSEDLRIEKIKELNGYLTEIKKRYVDLSDEDKKIYNELNSFVKPKSKTPFVPEVFSGHFDYGNIVYTNGNHIYEKKYDSNSFVKAYRATYEGQKVIVKYYENCSQEILAGVQNEINILIYLSNRLRPGCLFLRFIGSLLHSNNCFLVIEDGGEKDLMQYISSLKQSREKIPRETLENWIRLLISTFSWLNAVGIYHKDIKPHNIVINETTIPPTLKIIDFSVSDQREEPEMTNQFSVINIIQGTKGYMAPEIFEALQNGLNSIKYKQGKADTFSLGITILQLFTFRDYNGWNDKRFNSALLSEVDTIDSSDWVKSMLKKMLIADPKERYSFKDCISFFPEEKTFENY